VQLGKARYRAAPPPPKVDGAAKWVFKEVKSNGGCRYVKMGKQEEVQGRISVGIESFKANPSRFLAISFQADMVSWPAREQRYTLTERKGTKGYQPAVLEDGWMDVLIAQYQRLPPLHELGPAADEFTEQMAYRGRLLHSSHPPLCPGRGDGVGDVPSLKLIGDVDPSDIQQGGVGDCWLLSGISSLAEFDGAIHKLFKHTAVELGSLPCDSANRYTVTLWDLPTWTQVDVVVDERLARRADGSGLLGCSPSEDGELWPCYVEKAVAIHCGGWDKIDGGSCTRAWAMLTGCREQYQIRRNQNNGKFMCLGWFNPNERRFETVGNSPHDGFRGLWPMEWPAVGGSGALHLEIDEDDLFRRLCEWDDENYIMAAGTRQGSDTEDTDGIIDGHAYSVLEVVNDACGTGIDLIKMRNPHGKNEIDNGYWDDDGPGWKQYPQIKRALNPKVADNGVFWLSSDEFFKYFYSVYLCASDMSRFVQE